MPTIIERSYSTKVMEKYWGPEDRYLVVPLNDEQVFKSDTIKDGTPVKVTIRMEIGK